MRFRGDIEGLRAVAVLAVMIGHAGVPFVPGGYVGVDVFFVISGFLITSLLVAERRRTGRVSLVAFYARRARRLLPAAAIVLLTTIVGTYLLLPEYRWRGIGWDTIASAMYWINWRLSAGAVDYLTADQAPSILQHFWSLAVEEQFYLIWPLLLIVVGRLFRSRRGWAYLGGLALVAIPSLLWSIYLTATNPPAAYFVTTTRLWELALGAGVAIVAGRLAAMPRSLACGLAWVGLAAILIAAMAFDSNTAFPGYAALLPTAGAAAVIAGGVAAGRIGPVVVLGLAPMRWIGAISYSLYLWHWPILIGAEARYGALSTGTNLLLMVFAVIPAGLTYLLVENPVRRSPALARRPWLTLRIGLACSLLPVAGAVAFQHIWSGSGRPPGRGALGAVARPLTPSAAAAPPVDDVAWFTPTAANARDDVSAAYDNRSACITSGTSAKPTSCVYGDPAGTFTVALVGDSHAAQWLPTLQGVAAERNWKIVSYFKSSCTYTAATVLLQGNPFTSCREWYDNVSARLVAEQPDLVLATSAATYRVYQDGEKLTGPANLDAFAAGLRTAWTALTAQGLKVAVIRDVPRPFIDVPECVSRNRHTLSKCAFDRSVGLAATSAQIASTTGLSGVYLLDLTEYICPTDRCPAIIGNVLVYRDNNHMTATYARTLVRPLAAALDALAEKLSMLPGVTGALAGTAGVHGPS